MGDSSCINLDKIPLDKSGKSTTAAFKNLLETSKKIFIKFGQIEVKSFTTQHFYTI